MTERRASGDKPVQPVQPIQPVPPVRWEMLTVGSYQENCYLLWREGKSGCVIVDPGDEGERIAVAVKSRELMPEVILLTHAHCDHIGAVGFLRRMFSLPVVIGEKEAAALRDPLLNLSAMSGKPVVAPAADQVARGGDVLSYEGMNLLVADTPGHSVGSVSYMLPAGSLVVSGDVLFAGSIGRTDLPGGDFETLMQAIDRELLSLPDETLVLPGHGEVTTIGRERRTNPFLLERHYG